MGEINISIVPTYYSVFTISKRTDQKGSFDSADCRVAYMEKNVAYCDLCLVANYLWPSLLVLAWQYGIVLVTQVDTGLGSGRGWPTSVIWSVSKLPDF